MPVVTPYTPEVTPRGLDGGFTNVDANPAAFGANVAGAAQQFGQDVDKASDTASDVIMKQAMLSTDAQKSSAIASYHQDAAQVLASYGQLRGYDAVNAQANVQNQLAQLRTKYAGQMTSPMGQHLFNAEANEVDTGFNQAIVGHAANEKTSADSDAFDSARQAAIEDYAQYKGTGATGTATGADGQPVPLADLASTRAENATIGKLELLGQLSGKNGSDIAAQALKNLHSDMAVAATSAALDGTGGGAQRASKILDDSAGVMDPVKHAALEQKVQEDLFTYGAAPAAVAIANGSLKLDGNGAAALPGSPQAAVAAAAKAAGVDPSKAIAIAAVESGIRNVANSSVKGATSAGVFQMNNATWAAMGGTAADRNDPQAQITRGVQLIKQNDQGLQAALHRAPTLAESYLAHQQGLGGALALINAKPGESAVQALTDAGVPNARAAVAGNLGASLKGQADTISASDFMNYWGNKVQTAALSGGGQAGASAGSAPPPVSGNAISATPTGRPAIGDVLKTADAYAEQIAPGNGRIQRQMESLVYSEYRKQTADERQKQADAWQQVNTVALSQGSWSDVPADAKQMLTPQQTLAAQKLLGANGGYAKQSDPTVLAALKMQYANHPDLFASADLTQHAHELSAGDFNELTTDQTKIVQKGQRDDDKVATLKSIDDASSRLLSGAGLGTYQGMKETQKQQVEAKVGQFQGRMINWASQFQSQNNRAPNSEEIYKQASDFLIKGWDGPTRGNAANEIYNFQSAPKPGGKFTWDVPQQANQQVYEALQRRLGRAPSPSEFVNGYKAARAAGFVP